MIWMIVSEGFTSFNSRKNCEIYLMVYKKNKNKKHRGYLFSPPNKSLPFRIVIITGVNRSGKSLLGSLIGSMENVEYIDEPWLPMMLPVMQAKRLIDSDIAKDILLTHTEELFYEMILLRRANFRPKDRSSIWPLKNVTEIFERMINLNTRAEACVYAKNRKSLLLYNLGGTLPFSNFFLNTFQNCKIIHVIRNGLDVATAVGEKKWFSNDNLRKPIDSYLRNIYHRKNPDQQYYMPWWVKEGEEELFLELSDFGKGLYFWRSQFEINENEIDKLRDGSPDVFREVKFEDIIQCPRDIVEDLSIFLKIKPSVQTESIIASVDDNVLKGKESYPIGDIPPEQLNKARKLLKKMNYSL